MALPRIEGDLGVPHPGEGAETENRHRYPAPHVGAAGGSGSRRFAPSELQRLPPQTCCGGSVLVNTRSLLGRAAGSDRLRRPSARSRGIRARYPVAHWPPALSYPPLE